MLTTCLHYFKHRILIWSESSKWTGNGHSNRQPPSIYIIPDLKNTQQTTKDRKDRQVSFSNFQQLTLTIFWFALIFFTGFLSLHNNLIAMQFPFVAVVLTTHWWKFYWIKSWTVNLKRFTLQRRLSGEHSWFYLRRSALFCLLDESISSNAQKY